jgi:hypothetical protein
MIKIIMILLRVLAVLLLAFASTAIGLILGAIIGGNLGNLAAANFVLVFNGVEGYEASGSRRTGQRGHNFDVGTSHNRKEGSNVTKINPARA